MVRGAINFFLILASVLPAAKALAGLSIPELDPYAVIEQDRKKEAEKKEAMAKTRDQASEQQVDKVNKVKQEELPPYCDTAKEFKQTYQELSTHELTDFPDRAVVRLAYEVTKGCDGAAQRFSIVLNLLLKTGVDKRKAVEFALHFAKRSDDQTTAFVLIFKGTFLEKYYDLDFRTALGSSLRLALDSRGNPRAVAEDFRRILDYCVTHQGTDLPFKTCAPFSLELSHYSYLYGDKGLADSFVNLMSFFDKQKEIDFPIGVQLKFAGRILKHGPKAIDNFQDQYNFGISPAMKLPQKLSMQLAVKVAENSIGKKLK